MMTAWTSARLNRLFATYNRRFWKNRLAAWRVDTSGDHQGGYGFCDSRNKRIHVRLSTHSDDYEVRATLVHEMAHAATNTYHGPQWRKEMERLRSEGAPTTDLDFLVPYSCRDIVTSFIDAAKAGASWSEALAELGAYGLIDLLGKPVNRKSKRILEQCRVFFDQAKKRRKRAAVAGS